MLLTPPAAVEPPRCPLNAGRCMTKPARRISVLSAFVAAATLLAAAIAPGAQARAQSLYNQPKYAAIVVDAATGEVLYARRADQPRYPASVTKIMTFYLV